VCEPLTLAAAVLEPAMATLALQHSLHDKLQTLQLSRWVAPDVPAMIRGDSTRLLQVRATLRQSRVSSLDRPARGLLRRSFSIYLPTASSSRPRAATCG
jgi:hypothetical protein